jgi:hypothetical protein
MAARISLSFESKGAAALVALAGLGLVPLVF